MLNKMNKKIIALVCIMLLAVAGVYLGGYLTQRHYQLQNNEETEHTFVCSLSSSFNCDLVNSSPYAELFGVPVALLGFFFYLTVFVVAVFALWKPLDAEIPLVITHGLTIFSIFFSIYLFYIAKFVIGALCPYCVMMYGVNAGLFITTNIAIGKTYAEMYVLLQKFVVDISNK